MFKIQAFWLNSFSLRRVDLAIGVIYLYTLHMSPTIDLIATFKTYALTAWCMTACYHQLIQFCRI